MKLLKYFLWITLMLSTVYLFAEDTPEATPPNITPSTLFLTETSHILAPFTIGLEGGFFDVVRRDMFNAHVKIGLGSVAEFSYGTHLLYSNILGGTDNLPSAAIKMKIPIPKALQGRFLKSAALMLMNTQRWNSVLANRDFIAASPDFVNAGVRDVSFELRMTALSLLLTHENQQHSSFHFGVNYIESESRNTTVEYIDYTKNENSIRNIHRTFGGYLGYTQPYNESTWFLFEISLLPDFHFDPQTEQIEMNHVGVYFTGIRFRLTEPITLDSGIQYDSNDSGLRDLKIAFNLNFLINLMNMPQPN